MSRLLILLLLVLILEQQSVLVKDIHLHKSVKKVCIRHKQLSTKTKREIAEL